MDSPFALKFIDHVSLTIADMDVTTAFYDALFGAEVLRDNKPIVRALRLGGGVQLSIHQFGNGVDLVARRPTPGSADFCFRIDAPIAAAVRLLGEKGIAIVDGPSPRTDNQGRPAQSVYCRDPDGNLVELMATD